MQGRVTSSQATESLGIGLSDKVEGGLPLSSRDSLATVSFPPGSGVPALGCEEDSMGLRLPEGLQGEKIVQT